MKRSLWITWIKQSSYQPQSLSDFRRIHLGVPLNGQMVTHGHPVGTCLVGTDYHCLYRRPPGIPGVEAFPPEIHTKLTLWTSLDYPNPRLYMYVIYMYKNCVRCDSRNNMNTWIYTYIYIMSYTHHKGYALWIVPRWFGPLESRGSRSVSISYASSQYIFFLGGCSLSASYQHLLTHHSKGLDEKV